jgi:excisionase family DNA binding protein
MAKSSIPVQDRVTLSPQQAADLMGLSKNTLQTLLDSGDLPSFTVGNRRLISRDSIDELIRVREGRYTAAAKGRSPEEAKAFLQAVLASKPIPERHLRELADDDGISWKAINSLLGEVWRSSKPNLHSARLAELITP